VVEACDRFVCDRKSAYFCDLIRRLARSTSHSRGRERKNDTLLNNVQYTLIYPHAIKYCGRVHRVRCTYTVKMRSYEIIFFLHKKFHAFSRFFKKPLDESQRKRKYCILTSVHWPETCEYHTTLPIFFFFNFSLEAGGSTTLVGSRLFGYTPYQLKIYKGIWLWCLHTYTRTLRIFLNLQRTRIRCPQRHTPTLSGFHNYIRNFDTHTH